MIKYRINLEIEKVPENCSECPMFHVEQCLPYEIEANCQLGYMKGNDMRGFSGRTMFSGCRIGFDRRVKVGNFDG